MHTQLLWLSCVWFCLLSGPQIYCWFCWQRDFCFQNSVWESLSRSTRDKFIGWFSIYFECSIYPSVYFKVSLFFQCVCFSPLSHFPPCLSSVLTLVPVITVKKKARTVLSLGMAQSFFKLKPPITSSLKSSLHGLTVSFITYPHTFLKHSELSGCSEKGNESEAPLSKSVHF